MATFLDSLITDTGRYRPENLPEPLRNAARAFYGQGVGMGWGDEAEAWLRARAGEGEYEQNLNKIRNEYARYSQENPFKAGAAEFSGGVAPGVAAMLVPGGQGVGAAQVQRSTAGALARLALMGGVTGAVSGAGSATEGERASGAVAGGALGTALGVGVPVALRGARGVGGWLRDRLAPTEAGIAGRAAEKMTAAMRESQLTPQQIEAAMLQDRAMGVPSVVANVNPALIDLAEAVAQRTGAGARRVEKTLTEQKLGSRERAYQQTVKGLKPGEYYADEQRMVQELRDKARTLYDTAYAHGTVDDPRINTVLKNPEFASFFEKGKAIANTEAMAAKLRGEDPGKYALRDIYLPVTDDAGRMIGVESKQLPDVRTLDYMKRGIDATIDNYYKNGRSAEANALKDLRKVFVSAIDENAPTYQQARKGFAGDMEVIDAMRTGMNDFGKLDHEQVIKMVAGMGVAEKEAFRTGVARGLYSRIMDPATNFNSAQRVIGSPEMQAKLQPLFDSPKHFDLFKSAMEREAQLFHQANKVLGGSQTGKRLQMKEQLEAGSDVGQAVARTVTGGFAQGLLGMTMRSLNNSQITEKTAEKLSQMLMAKDPHEVAAVVQALEKYAAGVAPRAVRASATEAGAVTGTAAVMFPSPSETGATQAPADLEKDITAPAPALSGPDIEADITAESRK